MFEEQQEDKESLGKVMQVRVEGNDVCFFIISRMGSQWRVSSKEVTGSCFHFKNISFTFCEECKTERSMRDSRNHFNAFKQKCLQRC